ncbi:MAG: 6-phosphogluconolactonase, partial [Paracoccaceae bacterium]
MNIIEYTDREIAAIDVANTLAGELENALFNHETVSLAVPGGGTPGPIFSVLSAANIDWSRVCVMPTDERCVPEDHKRSNALLIRNRLLTERAAAARYLSLTGDPDNPEATAEALSAEVSAAMPLSVLVLGMGTDM